MADQIERVFSVLVDGSPAINTLEKLAKSADDTNSKIDKLSKGFERVGKLTKFVAAVAGVQIGLQKITSTVAKFQDLRTSLEVVTGSATQAVEQLGKITDLAGRTPFSLEEMTSSFIRLKSAGLRPTQQQLLLFSDTASVTVDKVKSLNAIVDLYAKGSQGRLRLYDLDRLANAGIPVFDILNKKIGIARTGINDYVLSAKGAETVLRNLEEGLTERFSGASEKALNNLNVVTKKLATQWEVLIYTLSNNTGFSKLLVNGVKATTTALNGLLTVVKDFETARVQINIESDGINKATKGIKTLSNSLDQAKSKSDGVNKNLTEIKGTQENLDSTGVTLSKNWERTSIFIQESWIYLKGFYNTLTLLRLPFYQIEEGAGFLKETLLTISDGWTKLGRLVEKGMDFVFNTNAAEQAGGVIDNLGEKWKKAVIPPDDQKTLDALNLRIDALNGLVVKSEQAAESGSNKFVDAAKALEEQAKSIQALSQQFKADDKLAIIDKKIADLKSILEFYKTYQEGLNDDVIASSQAIIDNIAITQDQAENLIKKYEKQRKNVLDTTSEFDKQFKKAIVNGTVRGLETMSDAFVDFATKGKANFKDLTASVLADIAKILIRVQLLNALKSIPALSGFFSPGGGTGGGGGGTGGGTTRAGSATSFGNLGGARNSSILTDAGFTNAMNAISSAGGGGSTTVNVVNNTSSQAEVSEQRNTDGTNTITVMIEEKIKETISTGRLDDVMAGNYGLVRRGY